MSNQIIFYTFPASHYAHRVWLALEEAQAEYTQCVISLATKPEWYAQKVNHAGEVPAIVYGPACSPEDPSPECATVTESLVILEFLADIFPNGGILPTDPVERARVRRFVAYFGSAFEDKVFNAVFIRGQPTNVLLDGLLGLQARLPVEGGFVVGQWSMAEMVAAPFLVRTWMMLEHDIGKYPAGEGFKAFEILRGDPKYARIVKYVEDIKDHASFKKTWDETTQLAIWRNYHAVKRD